MPWGATHSFRGRFLELSDCYQGWQESLELLAKLVEPGIPDGA